MTDRPGGRRRRPHAAAVSRIAVGGLSIAGTSGMVTAMALGAPTGTAVAVGTLGLAGQEATGTVPAATPAPVVVVRRTHVVRRAAPDATPSRPAAVASTPTPAPAPVVTPAPRPRPTRPATTSSSTR